MYLACAGILSCCGYSMGSGSESGLAEFEEADSSRIGLVVLSPICTADKIQYTLPIRVPVHLRDLSTPSAPSPCTTASIWTGAHWEACEIV